MNFYSWLNGSQKASEYNPDPSGKDCVAVGDDQMICQEIEIQMLYLLT